MSETFEDGRLQGRREAAQILRDRAHRYAHVDGGVKGAIRQVLREVARTVLEATAIQAKDGDSDQKAEMAAGADGEASATLLKQDEAS